MFASLLSNKSSRSFSNELLVNNRLFTKLALLYHTLKYLKFSQFLYQIRYKVFSFRKVSPISLTGQYIKILSTYDDRLKYQQIDLEQKTITLQNEVVLFDVENIDWHPSNTKRLWRYHLHYFDLLRQEGLSNEVKARIIDSWIAKNPQGTETAWEPYTLSLRVVNWIVWFSKNSDTNIQWIENLYMQCRWLRSNLELHILANHYFENLRALFFASIYFSELQGEKGKEVNGWKVFSIRQLCSQLDEQFLADGGHYERSPQYHCIMIKGCIEILWLIKKNDFECDQKLVGKLEKIINAGLSFIDDILRPDGEIPLFNDSSFDATPNIESLFHAGVELGVFEKRRDCSMGFRLIDRNESGYFGVKTTQDWILIDCGDIGPNYQPGHTHCDFLSFELMLNGQPVIVNSGVFEYEPGQRRKRMRSTRSHNTVCIGYAEQSEIWGSFRVAKRAKRVNSYLSKLESGNGLGFRFQGSFYGFFSLGGIIHERVVDVLCSEEENKIKAVRIKNKMLGKRVENGLLNFQSYFYFHPSMSVALINDQKIKITKNESVYATMNIGEGCNATLDKSMYCPEFSVQVPNFLLKITSDSPEFEYSIDLM